MKELLEKYLKGSATPEEVRRVDEWYDSLRNEPGDLENGPDADESDLKAAWVRVSGRLDRSSGTAGALWPRVLAAAAVFAGLSMVVYFLIPSDERRNYSDANSSGTEMVADARAIKNTTDEVRHLVLSDGSTVALFPGSSLDIDSDFEVKERSVTLLGRASFDVSKDDSKPFYVLTGEVITKVVGTRFTVDAYPESKEITVEVRSGAVSVYANADDAVSASGVLLKPNQQAVFNKTNKRVSRSLVKEPQIVIPAPEVDKIRFEGAAVTEIFKALERMYGVEIEFDEETFSTCSMTTAVSRGDLYEKMDVICEITGAKYSVEGTRIVITGAGCN